MTDGVLHIHEDGRRHQHFSAGFEIGGQVIADADGTEQHEHSKVRLGSFADVIETSGPVVELVGEVAVCGWCGDRPIDNATFADLDPADPEVGPRPDLIGFCGPEHRREFLAEIADNNYR